MDDELRRKLRKAAQLQSKWREERDNLIRDASQAGATLRDIAAVVGLSHVSVMKIVNKGTSMEPPQIIVDLFDGDS